MIVNVQLEVTKTLEGDILETKFGDEKDSNRLALSGHVRHEWSWTQKFCQARFVYKSASSFLHFQGRSSYNLRRGRAFDMLH